MYEEFWRNILKSAIQKYNESCGNFDLMVDKVYIDAIMCKLPEVKFICDKLFNFLIFSFNNIVQSMCLYIL